MKKKLAIFLSLSAFTIANLSYVVAKEAPKDDTDIHEIADPLEGFNRAMFKFNDVLDIYILSPVARGYRNITTKDIRARVSSAFSNLKEPMSVVNHLLQGDPQKSVTSVGRFLVNSTLGLGGTFDVAPGWGWKNEISGFDQTLAVWCVPDGPYLVLPFLGPSTPRATVGKVADYFSDPVFWATVHREDGIYASAAINGAEAIVSREATLDLTDDFRRNSVDYYTTMRTSYIQNRSKLNCMNKDNQTSAYDFDFGIDE